MTHPAFNDPYQDKLDPRFIIPNSEDTPIACPCKDCRGYCVESDCPCEKHNNPPQDTSLDEILRKHRLYVQLEKDTERIERGDIAELKKLLQAWHKQELAKVFERIRSEVIGKTKPHDSLHIGDLKTKQRKSLNNIERELI